MKKLLIIVGCGLEKNVVRSECLSDFCLVIDREDPNFNENVLSEQLYELSNYIDQFTWHWFEVNTDENCAEHLYENATMELSDLGNLLSDYEGEQDG